MSQVAQRMYLHPSTVSGIADRLEAKGLVTRVRRSEDHRLVHLEITETGVTVVETAPTPMRQRLLRALELMPEAELAALAQGLARLADASRSETVDSR